MNMLDKRQVLEVIESEPEYPGDAPPMLMECIRQVLALPNPEKGVLEIARLAVRQTKRCIAENVNKLKTH